MKIGIVIRRFHTRGGTERRTHELVRWLLAAGHQIHLFAEEWDSPLADQLTCHRIHTVKLMRWLKALSFAMLAARATRRVKLDLIHSQARTYADDVATLGGGCHADYLDRFVEDMSPFKQFWERHHPFNRVTLALEAAQYRRCRRIILNSHLAKAGLVKYFPWAEEKCRVVHNGIDPDFFKPDPQLRRELRTKLNLTDNRVVYLFVGSGFERKGLPEFMRALAVVKQRQPSCSILGLVVGNGNFPIYRALAKELDIEQEIHFAGAASDTRAYYCVADVFVLPTRFDPYANTTNEALASGLPVITTRTNGGHEVLTPQEGCVINHTGDVEALAGAMGALLDEPCRHAMSLNARELALRHSWRETAQKTLAVYQEILSEQEK